MKSLIVSTPPTIILTFVLFVGGIGIETAHGQSDVYLEAKVKEVPAVKGAHDLNIVKFEMQGEKYKEICPSLQCKIDYKDKYTFFSPPDIPQSNLMWAQADFTLHDDITHADLGAKKKQLLEEYNMNLYCEVYDIVEKNGQELYYCHNANLHGWIANKFDNSKLWGGLDSTGIYDAKNETLKMSGNFTE
jgi:hypothetical protein